MNCPTCRKRIKKTDRIIVEDLYPDGIKEVRHLCPNCYRDGHDPCPIKLYEMIRVDNKIVRTWCSKSMLEDRIPKRWLWIQEHPHLYKHEGWLAEDWDIPHLSSQFLRLQERKGELT